MELLLNSLNFKVIIITLINGYTIKGTLEYRKVILDKAQYKSIGNKRLKMILLKDMVVTEESPHKSPSFKRTKLLFVPIKSILSLTCPQVTNPSKHIQMYVKSSMLRI